MSEYLEAAASESGLSAPQLSLLGMIARYPGYPQLVYGQILVINKMSTSRYAAQLEELGLIERQRGPSDKREMRLHATPKGMELFETLKARLHTDGQVMRERAQPDGYTELEAQLRRFLSNEGWTLPDPAPST